MAITTSINYPSCLPMPQADGHSYQHASPFVRTDMATGRAKQRRRFSSVPTTASFTFLMSNNEFAAFEAWFRDQLNDGANWFNMNAYTPLGPNTPVVCRFMEMYSAFSAFGTTHWEFSVKLEFFERPLVPLGFGNFPDYLTGASILDTAVNQLWMRA